MKPLVTFAAGCSNTVAGVHSIDAIKKVVFIRGTSHAIADKFVINELAKFKGILQRKNGLLFSHNLLSEVSNMNSTRASVFLFIMLLNLQFP